MSCSSVPHEYKFEKGYARSDFPKQVFLEDQIDALNSRGILPTEYQSYCEIRKKDGTYHSGKLINIAEKYVYLSIGYDLEGSRIRQRKKEKNIKIPKDEILILKIW